MPALQRKGKSVVLDVNKAEHYAVSHIPKSINFSIETLNAENKALLKHKDSTVIVACQTGSRSTKAAKQLIALGFTNVNILNGGLVAWSKENLPLTKA
jgi:rhodanese-related sulfurtransferase